MPDRKLIMLVDDEPQMLTLESAILQDRFDVVTAGNGQEALQVLETRRPDLIVLDLMMPVMDGHEFCNQIQQRGGDVAEIPIVMVTALSGSRNMEKGYLEGAAGYISKPFRAQDLIDVVETIIEAEEQAKRG